MLLSLPEELLLYIAQYLTARELVSLSATSRRCRNTALTPRLWYNLLLPRIGSFNTQTDYVEEYAWRHGHLAVDVQSGLIPTDQELFKLLTFFPLHRSYSGQTLASLSPEYLPWATEHLACLEEELLVLACREGDMIAHLYKERPVVEHQLVILRKYQAPLRIKDLRDWPLAAAFIGTRHIVVCGRFPALLLFDLANLKLAPMGIPLSSHTINCMAFDNHGGIQRFVVCGHYKGRGSMEIVRYTFDAQGDVTLKVEDRNRFAGITAIASCAFLPSGSIMTYDNYNHIHLWSTIHSTVRKIDHDGIGDDIPSDMVYKMFYSEQQLIFIDQYKRQYAFVIRPGKGKQKTWPADTNEDDDARIAAHQMKEMLLKQSGEMTSLTRRILGLSS